MEMAAHLGTCICCPSRAGLPSSPPLSWACRWPRWAPCSRRTLAVSKPLPAPDHPGAPTQGGATGAGEQGSVPRAGGVGTSHPCWGVAHPRAKAKHTLDYPFKLVNLDLIPRRKKIRIIGIVSHALLYKHPFFCICYVRDYIFGIVSHMLLYKHHCFCFCFFVFAKEINF